MGKVRNGDHCSSFSPFVRLREGMQYVPLTLSESKSKTIPCWSRHWFTVKPRQVNISYLIFDIPVLPCLCCFHSCSCCCVSHYFFPAGTVILFPGVTESRVALCGLWFCLDHQCTAVKFQPASKAASPKAQLGSEVRFCSEESEQNGVESNTQGEWDAPGTGQDIACHVSHTGTQNSNPTEEPNRSLCKAAWGTELQLWAMSSTGFNTSSKERGVLLWTVDFIRNFLLIHQ